MEIPSGVTGERLSLIIERLVRALRGATSDGSLSPSAASALGLIDREGPQRVTDLARADGVTQPTMTQLVARLDSEGLATRTMAPTDRRAVLVDITEAGRSAIAARRRARLEELNLRLATLDSEQLSALIAALPALEQLAELHDSPRQPQESA